MRRCSQGCAVVVVALCAGAGRRPAAVRRLGRRRTRSAARCSRPGFGTAFPQPDADPFCVEFDKRAPERDQLGVVDFLSQEPARVAAASPQVLLLPDRPLARLDRAGRRRPPRPTAGTALLLRQGEGAGGVAVSELPRGRPVGRPAAVPGFPAEYRPYFGKGRAASTSPAGIDVEPRCVELAKREPSTAARAPGSAAGWQGAGSAAASGASASAHPPACAPALGAPTDREPLLVRYCMEGGGTLSAGFLGVGARTAAP